jgi:hypothetical protein
MIHASGPRSGRSFGLALAPPPFPHLRPVNADFGRGGDPEPDPVTVDGRDFESDPAANDDLVADPSSEHEHGLPSRRVLGHRRESNSEAGQFAETGLSSEDAMQVV